MESGRRGNYIQKAVLHSKPNKRIMLTKIWESDANSYYLYIWFIKSNTDFEQYFYWSSSGKYNSVILSKECKKSSLTNTGIFNTNLNNWWCFKLRDYRLSFRNSFCHEPRKNCYISSKTRQSTSLRSDSISSRFSSTCTFEWWLHYRDHLPFSNSIRSRIDLSRCIWNAERLKNTHRDYW